ncbi:MAG: male genitalia morphogenesis [Marteilia pararefringens]
MENYETQFTEAKLASSCLVMMFEQISVEFLSKLDIESEILCLLEIAFSTIKQHSYHSYYVVLMNIIEIIVQFRPFVGRTGEIFAKFDKSLACLRNDTKSYFEAIKCINIILDNNPIKLAQDSNAQQIFDNLLQNLICIGDIESQLATMELILRVFNSELFQKLSYSPMLHEEEFQLLTTIEMNSFESDCRKFLTKFNSTRDTGVISIACVQVFPSANPNIQYKQPQEKNYDHFWVDFNMNSERISIICSSFSNKDDETYYDLWQTISLPKSALSGYSINAFYHKKIPENIGKTFELTLSFNNPIYDFICFGPHVEGKKISIIFPISYHVSVSSALTQLYGNSLASERISEPCWEIKIDNSKSFESPQAVIHQVEAQHEAVADEKFMSIPKMSEPVDSLVIKMYNESLCNSVSQASLNTEPVLSLNESIKTIESGQNIGRLQKHCQASFKNLRVKDNTSNNDRSHSTGTGKIHERAMNEQNQPGLSNNILSRWKDFKENSKKSKKEANIPNKKIDIHKFEIPRIDVSPEALDKSNKSQSHNTSLYSFKSLNESYDLETKNPIESEKKPKTLNKLQSKKLRSSKKGINEIKTKTVNSKKAKKTVLSSKNANVSDKNISSDPFSSTFVPKPSALKFTNLQNSLLLTPDVESDSKLITLSINDSNKNNHKNEPNLGNSEREIGGRGFDHVSIKNSSPFKVPEQKLPKIDANKVSEDDLRMDNVNLKSQNYFSDSIFDNNETLDSKPESNENLLSIPKSYPNKIVQESPTIKSDNLPCGDSDVTKSSKFDGKIYQPIRIDDVHSTTPVISKERKVSKNTSPLHSMHASTPKITKKSSKKKNEVLKNCQSDNYITKFEDHNDHLTDCAPTTCDDDIVSSFAKFCDNIQKVDSSNIVPKKSPDFYPIKSEDTSSIKSRNSPRPQIHNKKSFEYLSRSINDSPKVDSNSINLNCLKPDAVSSLKLKVLHENHKKILKSDEDIRHIFNEHNDAIDIKIEKINRDFSLIKVIIILISSFLICRITAIFINAYK